jgi:uncharacterized protein (TIGR00730 family)
MKKAVQRQVCAVLPAHIKEDDLAWSTGQLETLFNIRKGGFSSQRLLKIMNEFINGYRFIRHYKRAVSVFGSARAGFREKVYQDATKLGFELASDGFAVITGGGPGIMEAANAGALKAGGESVGLNIQLPDEQRINPYVNESTSFHYFFTRKVMLASASQVYVFFPGGYGTMDELFEMLTLVQTKKVTPVKIVLVNKAFWNPLVDWIKETMYRRGKAINKTDLDLFEIVDGADEALTLIRKLVKQRKLGHRSREINLLENKRSGIQMPKKQKKSLKLAEVKIVASNRQTKRKTKRKTKR